MAWLYGSINFMVNCKALEKFTQFAKFQIKCAKIIIKLNEFLKVCVVCESACVDIGIFMIW